MRRNVRTTQQYDYDSAPNAIFKSMEVGESSDLLQLDYLPSRRSVKPHRFENTLEAKVEAGDTLQALALRFHCSVADIKRLNKIDKDNEIHAHKVVKIPVTVHSVLLGGTLPAVHKSGNSSPRQNHDGAQEFETPIFRNPLEDAPIVLSEKLMVASVNASETLNSATNVNQVILNSKLTASGRSTVCTDVANVDQDDINAPLINDFLDDTVPQPRPIRGPSMRVFDWNGSDCDLSWVCLFVVILALCFVIPLIYVIYLAEHPHHHNQTNL